MADIVVDPDAIMTCRAQMAEIYERATEIIKLAEDADPEWYIWGLIGAPFAIWYWQYAADIYDHLRMMGEALHDRIDALDCTAQAYKHAEDEMAKALKAIQDLLD